MDNTPVSPALEKRVFRDIDEQAACLAGYDQRYQQLGRGRFVGEFTTWRSHGGVAVHLEAINQSLHQRGHAPLHSHSVGLLLQPSDRCTFNGQAIDADSLFVLPPGCEYDASVGASSTFCVIQVARSTIEADRPDPGLATRFTVKRPGERRMALLRQQLRLGSGDDRTLHHVLLQQMNDLLAAPDTARRGPQPAARQRLRAFRRACDFLQAHAQDPLTMQQVCDAAAVSRRTLEYCFAEQLGQSPAAYLRALRLNGVHRALQSGEAETHSVGDLAARWGLWHASRFARDYRLMFDERPSETASRTKQALRRR